MSEIAVVIPTYNRATALLRCLEHLERQTMTGFDVVVVDDGSTDGTEEAVAEDIKATPLRLQYVRQQNAGPARARNRGIAIIEAPVCLMIGDDIFADRELVAEHLRFHREQPKQRMAALGLTRWSEVGQEVTPFMRWLNETDLQFSYKKILAGMRPAWGEFFTSNLSVKTALLRRNPFDERFRGAAMEDIELGYRLQKQGELELRFLPGALAWHLHPTSFAQACRRLQGVGAATELFHELWPEQRPSPPRKMQRWAADVLHGNTWILDALIKLADVVTRWWCPNPLIGPVLRFNASRGYRKALQSRSVERPRN